jgi:hypothetical protein
MEATFDARDFTQELNRRLPAMAAQIRRDAPSVIRTAARTLCRELANLTQPYGMGAKTRARGQTTAANDLARVYVTPSQVYDMLRSKAKARKGQKLEDIADAFYAAITSGDHGKARSILQGSGLDQRGGWSGIAIAPFDGGQAHRRMRENSTGRVPKGAKPAIMLTDSKGLKEYRDAVLKEKVGSGKSAWAEVARQLESAKDFPAWLTRISAGKGHVESHLGDAQPSVKLVADMPYMSRILSERDIRTCVTRSVRKLEKMVRIITQKAAEKL